MNQNIPFFADLSTYTPQKTMNFYKNVFGWNYYQQDNYFTAFINEKEITGLYETPQKFKQINMPSFWMTYIKVSNVRKTVAKATQLGAIIEATDKIPDTDKFALIRDPQGAGFTIYEGTGIQNTRTQNTKNTLIWNELHVADVTRIIPFYQGIFNWKIQKVNDGFYTIFTKDGQISVADILEIPNQLKGKFEYWVCTFGVDNLQKAQKRILQEGGSVINTETHRLLCADNSHEAFFYIQEV